MFGSGDGLDVEGGGLAEAAGGWVDGNSSAADDQHVALSGDDLPVRVEDLQGIEPCPVARWPEHGLAFAAIGQPDAVGAVGRDAAGDPAA